MKQALTNRLREPSTWAGVSILAGMFGIQLPPGLGEAIATIIAGVSAVAAVVVPERRPDPR